MTVLITKPENESHERRLRWARGEVVDVNDPEMRALGGVRRIDTEDPAVVREAISGTLDSFVAGINAERAAYREDEPEVPDFEVTDEYRADLVSTIAAASALLPRSLRDNGVMIGIGLARDDLDSGMPTITADELRRAADAIDLAAKAGFTVDYIRPWAFMGESELIQPGELVIVVEGSW